MSCRSPKHPRLAERLEAITHEALVVVVVAGDLAKGEPLTDEVRERLNLAARRIAEPLHGPR